MGVSGCCGCIQLSEMKFLDYFRTLKSPELRTAWVVAIAADTLQLAAMPLFVAGGISPAEVGLDLIVAVILIRLLGWHWAFLPSLLAELVPGFDLFPTWTAALFYVTHERVQSNEPEILPPDPSFKMR